MMNETKKITGAIRCSFCKKRKSEVRLLITGPCDDVTGMSVCICDKCVSIAKTMVLADSKGQVQQLISH